MKRCDICPIITSPDEQEQRARLIEDKDWVATLRLNDQSLLGTAFITAKNHVESLSDLTTEEWLNFKDIHDALEHAAKKAFGAAVINTSVLMNHAFRSSDPTPHVHAHFKPRYSQPVEFAGVRFEDPSFGSYLSGNHPRLPVTSELGVAIADEYRRYL